MSDRTICPNCTWRGDVELVDGVCPQCNVNWAVIDELAALRENLTAAVDLLAIREEQVGELLAEKAVLRADLESETRWAQEYAAQAESLRARVAELEAAASRRPWTCANGHKNDADFANCWCCGKSRGVAELERNRDPQDRNCPICENGSPIYRDGMCRECYDGKPATQLSVVQKMHILRKRDAAVYTKKTPVIL